MKIGIPPEQVAKGWENWCGITAWSKAMYSFGKLGGLAIWWSGYPQSKSAVPLYFALYQPDGTELPCESRLKDIKAGIIALEARKRG